MYKSLSSYFVIAIFVVLFFIVGVTPFKILSIQIPLIIVVASALLLCLVSIFASYLSRYKIDIILANIFALGAFLMLGMITSSLVSYSPYENASLPYYVYVKQIFTEEALSLLIVIILLSLATLIILIAPIIKNILSISTITLKNIIPLLEIDVNEKSSKNIKKVLSREYKFILSKKVLRNSLNVFTLLYAILAIVLVISVFNLTLGLFLQSDIESSLYSLLGRTSHAITYSILVIFISYIFVLLSASAMFFSNFRRYAINIKKLQNINTAINITYFAYSGIIILGISSIMLFLNDRVNLLFPIVLIFMGVYSLIVNRVSKEIVLILTQYEAAIKTRQIARGILSNKGELLINKDLGTQHNENNDNQEKAQSNLVVLESMESIDLFVAPNFFDMALENINEINKDILLHLQKKCGVVIPKINLIKRGFYEDISYQLRINKEVALDGQLFFDHLLVINPVDSNIFEGLPGELIIDHVYQAPGKWCLDSYKSELEKNNIIFQSPFEVLCDHVSRAIEARLHLYIDEELIKSIVKGVKQENRKIASNVRRRFSTNNLVYIYQKLLVERVPINNHLKIFSYLSGSHNTHFRNIINGLYHMFFEEVRVRLSDEKGVIVAGRLSQNLIAFLSDSIDREDDERPLVIDLGNEYKIMLAIFNYSRMIVLKGAPIVFVVPSTIRYEFLHFTRRFYMPEIVVLSEKEIDNIEKIEYKEEIDVNIV